MRHKGKSRTGPFLYSAKMDQSRSGRYRLTIGPFAFLASGPLSDYFWGETFRDPVLLLYMHVNSCLTRRSIESRPHKRDFNSFKVSYAEGFQLNDHQTPRELNDSHNGHVPRPARLALRELL